MPQGQRILVEAFARSDVGQTRDHNEDAFLVAGLERAEPVHFDRMVQAPADQRGTLFMVADGMGGAAAGEVASATAVETVLRFLREHWSSTHVDDPEQFVRTIAKATEVANAEIYRYAAEHPELRGMGTTATIAGLLGDTLYLAQVGDSRAYLLREGTAIQLTKDQSLMQKLIEAGEISEEEAEQSERRNIILQALGPEATVKIDLTHQQVRRGDVLILCSDGLSGLVKPDVIARVVGEEPTLQAACDRLIEIANELGGPDNITVVAARFVGDGLPVAASDEQVGHQTFPLGSRSGENSAISGPREAITSPVGVPVVDDNRRRKGERYVRLLAVVGVLFLLVAAWRLFRA